MRTLANFCTVATLSLLLIGCAPNYSIMPAEQLVSHIRTKTSDFDSDTITYLPPATAHLDRGFLGSYETIESTLGYSINKTTGDKRFALLININYNDTEWHFYESAQYRGGGEAQLFGAPSRKVGSCQVYKTLANRCDYTETVGIQLDQGFVLDHLSGFELRVSSRSGKHNIISIPGNYVMALRLALDKSKATASSPRSTESISQTSPPVTNLDSAGYKASDPTPQMVELARKYADVNNCGSSGISGTQQIGSRNIFDFGCTKEKMTVSCDFRNIDLPADNPLRTKYSCRWY